MWLRDSLPYDLLCARIIIYGHDTQLHSSRNFQDLKALGSSLRVDIEDMNEAGQVCCKAESVYVNNAANLIIYKRSSQ